MLEKVNLSDKKYQLFISSTFVDLMSARSEVIKVILNMYHIPIGMEMFSADNDDQWEIIKDTINNSDYYILIIGHRYGSVTKEGIGYTEKEFDYAKENGVPIYAYIRRREVATSPSERDSEPEKAGKLDAFIKKVEGNTTVEYWENPTELGQKVSIAMTKAFRRYPRVGWVRSDIAALPETLKELTILSKENRELKQENERLRINNKATPRILVNFNGQDKILINMKKDFQTSKLIKRVFNSAPYDLPQGAHQYYSESAAKGYNQWLEKNSTLVEEYNYRVYSYEKSRNSIEELIIGLINTGSSKANDIHVNVAFLGGVKVLNSKMRYQLNDIPLPEGIPDTPSKIAIDAFNRASTYNSRSYSNPYSYSDSLKSSQIPMVENESVTLNCRSLIHTKEFKFDGDSTLYLMPLIIGEFKAEIQVICEEYSDSEKIEIPVIIKEY